MAFRMIVFALFYLLIICHCVPANPLDQLKQNGFVEIKNTHATKYDYNGIYRDFEQVILEAQMDEEFADALIALEEAFQNTNYKKIFCGAPAGYRNCTAEPRKHDNKKYFQFSAEYHDFVRKNHEHVLDAYPILKTFFDKLKHIDSSSKLLFKDIIESLRETHPAVVTAMYGDRRDLTVIIKVLSYDTCLTELSTSPHYDKSGLTIILDNDDKVNDRLVLSSYQEKFDFEKLRAPERKFDDNNNYTSALFILGSLLQQQGIDLKPTPHAVLPSQSEHKRHSIIAFALLPNIDTTGVQTMIIDKASLARKFCKMDRKFG